MSASNTECQTWPAIPKSPQPSPGESSGGGAHPEPKALPKILRDRVGFLDQATRRKSEAQKSEGSFLLSILFHYLGTQSSQLKTRTLVHSHF